MNKKDLREEYVTGGQGSERINGEEITLLPGVMHVVSPSDFHELIPQPSLSLIKICFHTSMQITCTRSLFPRLPKKCIFRRRISADASMRAWVLPFHST